MTQQGHIVSARSLLRRKTASGQMRQYHPVGLEATADPWPANSSLITRRRVLPFKGMTIEVASDPNAVTAIGTTGSLPIDPEGDQEADPGPDIKEVTPGTEGTQEVLLTHVLLEVIAQVEGPDHDPDPDLGPGQGLAEEGQGLIPTIINQGQSLGPDPSPHKVNIELNQLCQNF